VRSKGIKGRHGGATLPVIAQAEEHQGPADVLLATFGIDSHLPDSADGDQVAQQVHHEAEHAHPPEKLLLAPDRSKQAPEGDGRLFLAGTLELCHWTLLRSGRAVKKAMDMRR